MHFVITVIIVFIRFCATGSTLGKLCVYNFICSCSNVFFLSELSRSALCRNVPFHLLVMHTILPIEVVVL